jgi:hypothetical protein
MGSMQIDAKLYIALLVADEAGMPGVWGHPLSLENEQ